MQHSPFDVKIELRGWVLHWEHLILESTPSAESIQALRQQAERLARKHFELKNLSQHPTIRAVRRLFKQAGCDPTRYRPSSEALLRRILKGGELPAIHPLVDLNNVLSVDLAIPCCLMAEGTIEPPITLRSGRAGEHYLSLRGPFNLEGKPVMTDAQGPFGTPISDSERVKVTEETRSAWLVAYLPEGEVEAAKVVAHLGEWVERLPGIELLR